MKLLTPSKKQLNVFVYGLFLILIFLSARFHKHNNKDAALLLTCLSIFIVIIYWIKRDFVIKFYTIWMKCASIIGSVVTSLLMLGIFYLVFAPIGILLRLLKKDLLNLKINPSLKTYWLDKPKKTFNKEDYEKQF